MKVRYAFRDKVGQVHKVKDLPNPEEATVVDLKNKIAEVTRIPAKWQSLLIGRPPKAVTGEGLLKDAIPSGSMITVKDARPNDDEKEVSLLPSVITKTLPNAKPAKTREKWTVDKLLTTQKFKAGEIVTIVGIKEKALNGKEGKIVEYEPNLNRWEVELGETTLFLSPDHLQSTFVEKSLHGPGFESLAFGKKCNIMKEACFAVKSRADYVKEWNRAFSSQKPALIRPKVSFTNSMVIFLFLGERRSGGYEIKANSVVEKDGTIAVYYGITTPQVHAKVTMGKTYPYHVLRVERSAKPIKYIYRAK